MRRSLELRQQLAQLPPTHTDRPAMERERMTAELDELRADLPRMEEARHLAYNTFEASRRRGVPEAGAELEYQACCRHCTLITQEINRLEAALYELPMERTA